MKNTIVTACTAIVVTTGIAVAFISGCSKKEEAIKPYASAYLDQQGITVNTTVDLSDGYSCEFSTGAAYLYDEKAEPAAMAITLDKDVYEDYVNVSKEASDSKALNDGVMFSMDNQRVYICEVGDSAYVGIFAENVNANQMMSIVERFTVEPGI